MKKEYDFSPDIRGNFLHTEKIQMTIRLDKDIVSYFNKMAEQTGIP